MKMITVTRWTSAQDDSCALILAGTPNQTREEASQYFEGGESSMVGKAEEMSDDEFAKLPEFQS